MGWKLVLLKKRIIPVQTLIDGRLVKTIQFDKYRDVGNPISSSKIYNDTDADELIFLNISRDTRNINPLINILEKVSEVCFMPLSIGGGINSFEDASNLIRNGADKIVINSIVYREYSLIKKISDTFGSQAVIVSIDIKYNSNLKLYELYSNCAKQKEKINLFTHLEKCWKNGAGEFFINSIDRDGLMKGYEISLIKEVVNHTNIPVIACGGAGNFEHMLKAFNETDVSALACGSLFNFGDNNPLRAKSFLSNHRIPLKKI